ncbi:hypothetical protein [Ktedonospora formicarum]|uniref:Uncharacterized protein n=1 Tax=Ktedonospora formicarum TaxID=2778364 RepID=A0A8J3I758_9CHLR|nr:hypothetical protein [Ktedonospora formicarum]GHO49896.1 hypothetical protein KSX_80590 [Ktedonospora formicarum]
MLSLITQAIDQTRSRILEGKKAASTSKILGLFELYTCAIPRHKDSPPVDFCRHVILDEVEGDILQGLARYLRDK